MVVSYCFKLLNTVAFAITNAAILKHFLDFSVVPKNIYRFFF